MAAPTIPVSAEENLEDPIDIMVDIIHPKPVTTVAFSAAAVVRTQAQHGEAIRGIHEHLLGVPIQEELTSLRFRGQAQNRMKQQADKGRFERQFIIGDLVLLKLQPHRQVTMRIDGKLAAQPLKILDRKIVKKKNVVEVYGLVQWTNGNVEDATWEPLDKLSKDYPAFNFNS
ncbi:retrotransposon-related protein [Tanacetum coccineum]